MVLTACAGEAFGRDDAIASLQTTGVSEVEATCMADTLIAVGQVNAADPRQERGDDQRAAFLAATERCVQVEVLSATAAASQPTAEGLTVEQFVDEEEEILANPPQEGISGELAVDDQTLADRGYQTLTRFGRSEANARCIIDHLVLVEAVFIVDDPQFGLGLDAFEADAMAACLSVN